MAFTLTILYMCFANSLNLWWYMRKRNVYISSWLTWMMQQPATCSLISNLIEPIIIINQVLEDSARDYPSNHITRIRSKQPIQRIAHTKRNLMNTKSDTVTVVCIFESFNWINNQSSIVKRTFLCFCLPSSVVSNPWSNGFPTLHGLNEGHIAH